MSHDSPHLPHAFAEAESLRQMEEDEAKEALRANAKAGAAAAAELAGWARTHIHACTSRASQANAHARIVLSVTCVSYIRYM